MKRFKTLFGILVPHKKGDFISIEEIADILFPLAYRPGETLERQEIRDILRQEIWGSEEKTILEVRKRMPKKSEKRNDEFYTFLNNALLEKIKLHGDRPFLSIEGFRKWITLKHQEYKALQPVEKILSEKKL